MKPKLLDLFAGAGGCSMGYHRAGFEVVGVDINFQKNYPFEFHQADAMHFPLDGFDVIHASPPCQKYSVICKGMNTTEGRPDLIDWMRLRLIQSGKHYVIENVVGAPLDSPVMLCGSMFSLGTAGGLWLRRHRLFESSFPLPQLECSHPGGVSIGVYGNGTNKWHRDKLGRCVSVDEQREAMGIDWMPRSSLSQSIPPAYTKWIGRQIMEQLNSY